MLMTHTKMFETLEEYCKSLYFCDKCLFYNPLGECAIDIASRNFTKRKTDEDMDNILDEFCCNNKSCENCMFSKEGDCLVEKIYS